MAPTPVESPRSPISSRSSVIVNNLSTKYLIPQTIGGAIPGVGNLISGNNNVGIELLGPQEDISGQNNVVEGNVIGLDAQGMPMGLKVAAPILGNGTGILIDNSPGNVVGGSTSRAGTGPGNIISGNSVAGIHVLDTNSKRNQILGNAIGTKFTGDGFPNGTTEATPPQVSGVLIEGGSNNTVGGATARAANVLSGNDVGVQIAGLNQGNSVSLGGLNVVAGNLIGTDWTGTQAVANLDAGVFINNSAQNIIGPDNVLSANGIAGVELLSVGSKGNVVFSNVIGTDIVGRRFPTPKTATLMSSNPLAGVRVFMQSQSNGVVIIGASGNTIGQANNITGNVQVGVYISSRDAGGNSYPRPVNNMVSGNTIQRDGLYGILLYVAPNNAVRPFTSQSRKLVKNTFGGNLINFRNFLRGFDISTQLLTTKSSAKSKHQIHPGAQEARRIHTQSKKRRSPLVLACRGCLKRSPRYTWCTTALPIIRLGKGRAPGRLSRRRG